MDIGKNLFQFIVKLIEFDQDTFQEIYGNSDNCAVYVNVIKFVIRKQRL